MTWTFSRMACVLLLSGAASVAVAHHSANLYFDGDKTVELRNATVVSLVLVNPHSRLEFTIVNTAGDVVTVIGNPSRKGTDYLRMQHLVLPNGDTVTFYGSAPAISPARP